MHKLRTLLVRGRKRTDGLASPYVLNMTRDSPVASHTVLSKLRTVYADTAPELPASECMDHLAAGIDTTGDGLCFLLHRLSQPAAYSTQAALRAELAAHAGRGPAALDALPYLDAVVREGLRVDAPIPMSLPRVVPAGGRTVSGAALPGGTVVSCQPYTLHRLDTRVFPEPDVFRPERWLDEEGAQERNQLFFAFAAGGRGCIGKQ